MSDSENPIRAEREKRGWSQYELARRCGIPQPHISAYESGAKRAGLKALAHLAAALEMSHGRLCDRYWRWWIAGHPEDA